MLFAGRQALKIAETTPVSTKNAMYQRRYQTKQETSKDTGGSFVNQQHFMKPDDLYSSSFKGSKVHHQFIKRESSGASEKQKAIQVNSGSSILKLKSRNRCNENLAMNHQGVPLNDGSLKRSNKGRAPASTDHHQVLMNYSKPEAISDL